jgi:hypothetical protein
MTPIDIEAGGWSRGGSNLTPPLQPDRFGPGQLGRETLAENGIWPGCMRLLDKAGRSALFRPTHPCPSPPNAPP